MQGTLFGPRDPFAVGDGVLLPACNTFLQMEWRGYLRVGPPGQRRRVPVYGLGKPHGDCSYEHELLPSTRFHFSPT